jgi:hypothetical protein
VGGKEIGRKSLSTELPTNHFSGDYYGWVRVSINFSRVAINFSSVK